MGVPANAVATAPGATVARPSLSTGPSGSPAFGGVTLTFPDPTMLQCNSTRSPAQMCLGVAPNSRTWASHAVRRHTIPAHLKAAYALFAARLIRHPPAV